MLKAIFLYTIFSFLGLSIQAQSWKILQQAPLEIEYEIPKNWYAKSFLLEKQCNCTGGTINTSSMAEINMIIFFSNKKEVQLDSLFRQIALGYSFQLNTEIQGIEIETKHFKYIKHIGIWKEDKNTMVERYSTQNQEKSYVIYFFGTTEDMEKNKVKVEKIISSIKEYKPREEEEN